MSVDFDDKDDLSAILSDLSYSPLSADEKSRILQNEYLFNAWKIDPSLSDEYSLVAHNDETKKVIHAVRGTNISSKEDLLTDVDIIGKAFLKYGLPMGTALGLYPRIRSKDIGKEIPYMFREEGQEVTKLTSAVSDLLQQRTLEDADLPVRFYENAFIRSILRRTGYGMMGAVPFTALGAVFDTEKRLKQEYEKHENVKNKYPDYNRAVTGHSLGGGIALHMSRTLNIPSVSFNPAPQTEHRDTPHPESKIVRTRFDPVSFLSSTLKEPENVKVVKSKYYDSHSITNFLPPKTPSKMKLPSVPKIERQNAFNEKPPKNCLENPNLPQCRKYFYV